MEGELAELAASGATTLVGLMVSDSWTLARERLGRFFARDRATEDVMEELDASRRELVAARGAGEEPAAADAAAHWGARLHLMLQTDPAVGEELRRLLRSLSGPPLGQTPLTVNNVVSGGVQHGPVIQSGRITGLAFHGHSPAPERDEHGAGGGA